VDLSKIEVLTLDEADRMLDMGFMPALRRVLAALPRDRQTLLFSATLSDEVVELSAAFTRKAERVDVTSSQVVATTVTHQVHRVAADRKRDALAQILTEHGEPQALVFCRTKRGANRVGEDLSHRGIRAGVIHGNKSQNARNRALDDFKAGRVRVLVATDIAARGLDIVQLPLVVNFDLPLVAEDYVHRVGRTGRAGHQGRAVSLASAADAELLRGITRVVKSPLQFVNSPHGQDRAEGGDARPVADPRAAGSPGPAFRRGAQRRGGHDARKRVPHAAGRHPQRQTSAPSR
jgi:ATP-dependent RNA helicase RhlE